MDAANAHFGIDRSYTGRGNSRPPSFQWTLTLTFSSFIMRSRFAISSVGVVCYRAAPEELRSFKPNRIFNQQLNSSE